MFDLFLFSKDREVIRMADKGSVSGIVVDWECRGKSQRQLGYDTQISNDSYDDLRMVRGYTDNRIICRINNRPELIDGEIEKAVRHGADEILVPMIRDVDEVIGLQERINHRCGLALMLETREAVGRARQLAELSVSRVFLGLQDLAIDFGYANIFKPLCENLIEQIRTGITVPFGFGGATLPEKGYPLPCKLLLSELVRLGCDFTFLRRSFLRDVQVSEIPRAICAIREYIAKLNTESEDVLAENRKLLKAVIKESDPYFDKINSFKNI